MIYSKYFFSVLKGTVILCLDRRDVCVTSFYFVGHTYTRTYVFEKIKTVDDLQNDHINFAESYFDVV